MNLKPIFLCQIPELLLEKMDVGEQGGGDKTWSSG